MAETMFWKEMERSKIRPVQMDNLKGLLGIKRMDGVPNTRIREFSKVKKVLDERIDDGMLRWFGQVERIENDKIAKRVYGGECVGSHSWKKVVNCDADFQFYLCILNEARRSYVSVKICNIALIFHFSIDHIEECGQLKTF